MSTAPAYRHLLSIYPLATLLTTPPSRCNNSSLPSEYSIHSSQTCSTSRLFPLQVAQYVGLRPPKHRHPCCHSPCGLECHPFFLHFRSRAVFTSIESVKEKIFHTRLGAACVKLRIGNTPEADNFFMSQAKFLVPSLESRIKLCHA